MTRRARLDLEYDGAHFRGWSRQPGLRTVEGELLGALEQLGLDVRGLRCAGRTDAGVHARAQVVSLSYDGPVPEDRLAVALNQHLPGSVAALASAAAPHGFDARSSALSRSYEYRVLQRTAPSPLRAARTLHHPRTLDEGLLHDAASMVLGQHDFTAFTPTRTEHEFFHRTVLASRWERRGDELVYHVTANAFLRHMVRTMVGTMLAIGRGDWPLERLQGLLEGASRADAHQTAPAHALCLTAVAYDAAGEPDTAE